MTTPEAEMKHIEEAKGQHVYARIQKSLVLLDRSARDRQGSEKCLPGTLEISNSKLIIK